MHRRRDILAKLPKNEELSQYVQAAYWPALKDATSPEAAEKRLRQLVGDLERQYPTAAACLADDLSALTCACISHCTCAGDWARRILLERSLEEVRRRAKVLLHFSPGFALAMVLGVGTL